MNSESSIEKTTTAESKFLDRRLLLCRETWEMVEAAIVAAVGGGVWISFAQRLSRRMGKPKGAVRGGGWIYGGGGGLG